MTEGIGTTGAPIEDAGLSNSEAARRLAEFGPNELHPTSNVTGLVGQSRAEEASSSRQNQRKAVRGYSTVIAF